MRRLLCLAVALASFGTISPAQTITTQTFGTGANAFTMDFVTIGNPGNAADTTGTPNPVGRVDYTYNLGKYEVSRDVVLKASTAGGLGLNMVDLSYYVGGNASNQPAMGISWNEAARFVNWLNESKGYQKAYKFTTSGANDNLSVWGAGQYVGNNQFRHKDAYFFLPSRDEWHKGAYYDPSKSGGAGYWNFATKSDTAPLAVSGGTTSGTAVYNGSFTGQNNIPSDITNAGGLSAYGTMAQNGNSWEWTESASDGINDLAYENRDLRGGNYFNGSGFLDASYRGTFYPTEESFSVGYFGFRVASIPEPSSLSLSALGGVLVALRRRR